MGGTRCSTGQKLSVFASRLPLERVVPRFILLLVLGAVTIAKPNPKHKDYASCDVHHIFNRSSFPPGFIFGSAGAAFQFEGAAKEGGRGPCVWDTFTHKYPDKITDRSNGDVAADSYHRYKALEDEYLGFLSPTSVSHFVDFAELCFKEFGDKVKHWITLNEPQTYSVQGYSVGAFAPGRCSNHTKCKEGGNSATEPYLAAHHQLIAHAAAVKVYREKYQASQKGVIGITVNAGWSVPFSNSTEDKAAAIRALDFSYGWYMNPVTKGSYPKIMQTLIGSRLPKFTKEQSNMLKGSSDFIGLNYYSSSYAKDVPVKAAQPSQSTDAQVESLNNRNGVPIGPMELTRQMIPNYHSRKLSLTIKELNSTMSIFIMFKKPLGKKGVNVKGFFAWALLDNFEWANGYTARFGIIYVDFKNGQERHYKLSARWWKNLLKGNSHSGSKHNSSKGNIKNSGSKPKSSKGDIL
ncbi:hypothetical protein C1H46_006969 [Malus baccata]|uniref:Beta-glucosidase n=1 Tax=Malus baccata TaxID=106549 RepID=A0A540N8F4_MALBA|nr:hypothetical protein C1H46_006969 [Malus baccata]